MIAVVVVVEHYTCNRNECAMEHILQFAIIFITTTVTDVSVFAFLLAWINDVIFVPNGMPPSYPASSFPLTSGRERTTLERSDLKSENSGLPVELRMPTVHDLFGRE